MATFPAYPLLLFNGYRENPESGIRRGEMESGPAKQLKSKSRVAVVREVDYLLISAADKTAFETWFRSTINMGADWFDWTDPADQVVRSARIVSGTYQLVPQRKMLDRWVASFQLETWSGG